MQGNFIPTALQMGVTRQDITALEDWARSQGATEEDVPYWVDDELYRFIRAKEGGPAYTTDSPLKQRL